jgi:preprotein translocase subunit SecF
MLLVLLSIAMLPINHFVRGSILNWTIDFKGGSEISMTFGKPTTAGEVRKALDASGHPNADVSSFRFTDETKKVQDALLVRLPEFGALKPTEADKVADAFVQAFGGTQAVPKATWSGDTFYARTTSDVTQDQFAQFFKDHGLEMKPWSDLQKKDFSTPVAGTTEHNYQIAIFGLDRNVATALQAKLGTDVKIWQFEGVGPKAGEELRNDGIKSLLYAIALIMLYIAFRFDFRYGPGTVASLLHDAVITVGVFALTWQEFSLTTVAAVLTVIGYSMNDTIVVFDRIRENEHKLKDKKFDRVINISINETLSRTILTSLATFLTTLAMNLLGTGLVKNFAFAMNIGIIVGTYSSVFVAAPILLWLNDRYFAKRKVRTVRTASSPSAAEPA